MKILKNLLLKMMVLLAFLTPVATLTMPIVAMADDCTDSSDTGIQKCVKNNQIVKDLNYILDFLSAGVIIIIIIMIIIGGIQYIVAGDNPQATSSAKGRITNALIALAAFVFAFAFLQWIIPGGL